MKLLPSLAVAVFLVSCSGQGATLRLGALTEEPAPTVAQVLADSLRDEGLDVSLAFFENSDEISAALAGNALDLALIEEPIAPLANVTTILPLYPSVLHILRRSAASTTIPDVFEGLIYAGPRGSFARRLATELAEDFGIDEIHLIDNPWTNEPDAYFVFGGLLAKDAIRQLSGFMLVDLVPKRHQGGESVVDALALRHPILRPFTLPADLYPTLSHEPIRTLSVTTLLVAGAEVSEDTAYRVTERLVENSRPMREAYPLMSTTRVKSLDLDSFALPLHRGARRYLERDLPGFLERYIDIIALLTTLLLATASGLVAWARKRKRARKERVDRYLTAVLDIRSALHSSPPGGLRARLDRIEKDVLELVVTEKIEIDAGLIAFLQLCASVRTELRSPCGDASAAV